MFHIFSLIMTHHFWLQRWVVDTQLMANNNELIYAIIVICVYLSEYVPNRTVCHDLLD